MELLKWDGFNTQNPSHGLQVGALIFICKNKFRFFLLHVTISISILMFLISTIGRRWEKLIFWPALVSVFDIRYPDDSSLGSHKVNTRGECFLQLFDMLGFSMLNYVRRTRHDFTTGTSR